MSCNILTCTIEHFIVCSVTWPLSGIEAGGDLTAFVVQAQRGLYQSKVTSSLASIRPGQQADN